MKPDTDLLQGNSPEFMSLLRTLRVAAATDVPVLLEGESGTGRQTMAHYLHRQSGRADHPFVVVHCAALQDDGMGEAELFGHRKGAFGGAVRSNPGRIRTADGGTLYLDEVAELPLALQAKLLRFLQDGEVQPVGESATVKVDVRLVNATQQDLDALVRQGRFREDLYYRLKVVPLQIPALRERGSDILTLLEHFLDELARDHELPPPRLGSAARRALQSYSWPGNVRELRNFCERMVILLPGQQIDPTNLPLEMRTAPAAAATTVELPAGGLNWNRMEQDLIRQALARASGNQSRAARLLGLTRDTLLYRIKKHGLQTDN